MLGPIRSLHSITDTFSPLHHLKRVEEVLGARSYQVTPLCHRHILSPSSSQKSRGGARCWVLSGQSTLSPTHSLPLIVSKESRRFSVLGPIRSLHSITDTFSPLDRLKRVEEVLGARSYQVTPLYHRHILSPSSSQKSRGGARSPKTRKS